MEYKLSGLIFIFILFLLGIYYSDIQQKIEDNYNTWCKHIRFDALEATFLPRK